MSDPSGPVDLLVVGGGVNGAGIARDAAGRGLSVLLVEQHDLAAHTSSASTKLVHGGLRYLEYREFRLVRKALQEREVLLDAAPHIMRPMRFVLPHDAHLRPAWLIRAGLFLYDHLASRRRLPDSQAVDLRTHVAGEPLEPRYRRGFVYSDGWVDDARLVVLSAVDAAARGATILTRTRWLGARREGGAWRADIESPSGGRRTLAARALVNAAGPWVGDVLHALSGTRARHGTRLVKGSHIVVPRLFDHDYAYIFQTPDDRIVFTIPYEHDFTLIGTTDVDFAGDPARVAISPEEIDYLCTLVNRYFRRDITRAAVRWSYSGVRPLIDDEAGSASGVTRDYALELDPAPGAPLLSVFGGKITTFRRLAEEAVDLLAGHLGRATRPWTRTAVLPGGDVPGGSFEAFHHALGASHPWLAPRLALRLARAYGTRVRRVLGDATSTADLGEEVLPGLHAAEIDYLVREEWARTAADILWRRSKLGLHVPEGSEAVLDGWLARRAGVRTGDSP